MHKETKKTKHLKVSNLTKLQQNGLNYVRNNRQHVILIADENIGLCAAGRNDHIATMTKNTLEIIMLLKGHPNNNHMNSFTKPLELSSDQ